MNNKIVGGSLAPPNRFDYAMAFFFNKTNGDYEGLVEQSCSRTLITASLILTNAFCAELDFSINGGEDFFGALDCHDIIQGTVPDATDFV